MDNSFNASYTEYWEQRVNQLSDGTKIADSDIADLFLPLLKIQPHEIVLDMGCSYGRFFPLLFKYTKHIIGIDIEANAIQKAADYPYTQLETSALEKMGFANESIDKAFCWATFDCTEQEQVLIETNRILKKEGLFLVTGKNINYAIKDDVAFIAERNAKLKSFPNHFTDIKKLYDLANDFGFKIEHGFAFSLRGDFGLAKAIPINDKNLNEPFYEYLLVLRKIEENKDFSEPICDLFSSTAREKAHSEGFEDVITFFKTHQDKYGI